MGEYTRMALVRPDLLETKTTPQYIPPPQASLLQPPPQPPDAQQAFYESQLVRERLSPDNSLVDILAHLQKKAFSVLHDESLSSSAKLSLYNQLMVQSSIMMKKAKAIGHAAATMNPTLLKRRKPTKIRRISDSSQNFSATDDSDNEAFEDARLPDTEDEASDAETGATGGAAEDERREHEYIRNVNREITNKIPPTYVENAKKLFKIISEKGRGHLNWSPRGELIVQGHLVPNSNIIQLLSDAVKPKSRSGVKNPPVGHREWTKVVKRFNPSLKHVKNKEAFEVSRARSLTRSPRVKGTPPSRRSPKSKSPRQRVGRKKVGQTGSGAKIVWHTKL